ncbi:MULTISPECIES: acetyltransferase [Acinetobacter]|uniref:acetyltransferase n=1 Tax=Acinetobacter TaxID=469 RepID=UPI00124C2273|nr:MULTISPECIES: acetyltransferase [Acinetobacter]MBO8215916.1 acetyltransferase [Acinetobacter nosocomialis]MDE3323825.1 acetyltransferase [Acinetobacter nosocomialis]MPS62411.1 acetyltransferase [Acinetobacter sp.]
MKELIIVGAGGHGNEISWLAKRCGRVVRGFLDNTVEKQGAFIRGIPVLGTLDECSKFTDCDFVIAIGSPRARKKIIERFFSEEEFTFATLIDPSATIGENIHIQEGTMICAGGILTVDVKLGKHCIVNTNAVLSHGVILGDYVTVAPNASISGDVSLGNIVEIGANATIREKVSVQDGAMVGMGSVVIRNILSNQVVVGNPAKLLKVIE